MRLNLVNLPSLIGAGLSTIACESFNPKFGNKVAINEDLFKYVLPGPPKEVFVFERVSLNELFEGNPQSIVGIVRRDWSEPTPFEIIDFLGTPLTTQEGPVEALDPEDESADLVTKQFNLWVQYIGLGGLYRADVDLTTTEGWLHVDARRSAVFKGSVSIKVQEVE
jgi:hypothetical protein